MDADEGIARKPASGQQANGQTPAQNAPGGTVEPESRAKQAIKEFQTPLDLTGGKSNNGERFEMWDPFNEVTYRAKSLPEIIATADRLQSSKFIAIDAKGVRTPVLRVDGEWRRGPVNAAAEREGPDAPAAALPSNVVPLSASAAVSVSAPAPSPAMERAAVKIEAQAERSAQIARIEAALVERYIIKKAPITVGNTTIGRMEYRFRGDSSRVAFTASNLKLATDTNSPSVARSMVDVAEARDWKALRVSGNEEFKRMVWLEASVRGVKTVGYEPNPADLDVLKRERDARQINRIEPTAVAPQSANPTEKASARGGSRKAVLVAIEAVLVAKNVPEKQREAIMTAAADKLAQRAREGQPLPKVKIYDKAAPSQRPVITPTPDLQRPRERAAPAR
jgi:hypothetical protein